MATGTITGMETTSVTFPFSNNVSATVNFTKIGAIVIVRINGVIGSSSTQPDATIISSEVIPVGFRPKLSEIDALCSRTDAGTWDINNGNGIKSLSTFRFYADGKLGHSMLTQIITGVDVEGTACYIAK